VLSSVEKIGNLYKFVFDFSSSFTGSLVAQKGGKGDLLWTEVLTQYCSIAYRFRVLHIYYSKRWPFESVISIYYIIVKTTHSTPLLYLDMFE
jgi:hypothetical protein